MANPEHVEIVKSGSNVISKWRADHPDGKFDLSGADLSGVILDFGSDLSREDQSLIRAAWPTMTETHRDRIVRSLLVRQHLADLSYANLSRANLAGSQLYRVNLYKANLYRADFTRANLMASVLSNCNAKKAIFDNANLTKALLSSTDLRFAQMRNSILRGAYLEHAMLVKANVDGADFSGAEFVNTIIGDTDFSNAVNLAEAVHHGASTVGIDSLIKSERQLCPEFLRGVGIPETVICYLQSVVQTLAPIEFYSCFISYSHKDEEFCKRLHSRMRDERLRVWYAPEDMPGGKKLHQEIDRAIHVHDKLLLVLSNESLNSKWVANEIRKARKREIQEDRQILFPIRLVSFEALRDWQLFNTDEGLDLAAEIREYFIPDFSNWKDHDAFETAFQRLLKDLKAGTPAKSE